jgi:ADP-ribosylglycohydrolase
METKITANDRIKEFHPPEQIPRFDEIEFEPPLGFNRAHQGVPAGTWSDDGAQALCLLASLLEREKFDVADFAEKLVAWYREDYMAVDQVFDVGIQTQRAILNLRKNIPPLEAGPREENKNGNGSLMRVLPLALWHRGADEELIRDAFDQSAVTHGHLRSKLCCALYCLWARRILSDDPKPWDSAVSRLRAVFPENSAARTELEQTIKPDDLYDVQGSGYVLDSLFSAKWACAKPNFEESVKAAISLGNDTDTTAAIAGGIAGLIHGVEAIPERWRENLRGKEIYEPLLDSLLANRL